MQGDSDAVVWTGDWSLRPDQQGLLVLGTPLGSDAFVQRQLELKRAEHDRLLTRIPPGSCYAFVPALGPTTSSACCRLLPPCPARLCGRLAA